jgi:hypothetical protein
MTLYFNPVISDWKEKINQITKYRPQSVLPSPAVGHEIKAIIIEPWTGGTNNLVYLQTICNGVKNLLPSWWSNG